MSITIKIRKGLEQDPTVFGLGVKYFHRMCGCVIVYLLLVMGALIQLIQDTTRLYNTIVSVLVGAGALMMIYILLAKKSNKPKYAFKRTISSITHRDILSCLQ